MKDGNSLFMLILSAIITTAAYAAGYDQGKLKARVECNEMVQWTIQDTSDKLYDACEKRIDRIVNNGCKL